LARTSDFRDFRRARNPTGIPDSAIRRGKSGRLEILAAPLAPKSATFSRSPRIFAEPPIFAEFQNRGLPTFCDPAAQLADKTASSDFLRAGKNRKSQIFRKNVGL
jgi:hypothetical protein